MHAPDDLTIEEYARNLTAKIGTQYRNQWSRNMFGPRMPPPYVAFNTAAHRDAITKFVDATGDMNLLFRDPCYASATRHGTRLAPPAFLYSIAYGHYPNPSDFAPPHHFHGLYAGDDYEWFDVIREGEEFDWNTTMPIRVELKKTRAIGDVIFVTGAHQFFRRGDTRLLARCTFWLALHAGRTNNFGPERDRVRHTPEYIRSIYAAQDAEIVRGDLPRFWEDVKIGETLQPVVRGPFTQMENIAWRVGGIGERYYISDRLGRFIHEETGWGEWSDELSIYKNFHDTGESAIGAGSQRSAWLGVLLTNWVGDDGFVKRVRSEHRARGQYGNVYFVRGTVAGKRLSGEEAIVDIDCSILDQNGLIMLVGSASVVLPTRALPVSLPLRPEPTNV
jgi:N-terminal half of MaoC dehydratase